MESSISVAKNGGGETMAILEGWLNA